MKLAYVTVSMQTELTESFLVAEASALKNLIGDIRIIPRSPRASSPSSYALALHDVTVCVAVVHIVH